jgi:predicted dehydrogenase
MEIVKVRPKDLDLPETPPMPERRDWRVGMVGFGGIARHAHFPALRALGASVVAVADPDPSARKAAREEFGVANAYEDYRDLIDDADVEIVEVLTQPTLREPIVTAALAARKPVLTEKPLATTIEECQRMVEAAEAAGVVFAVNQNYRWMPANFLARRIIEKGWIGEPFFAGMEMFGSQDVGLSNHPIYPTSVDFLAIQWSNHFDDLIRYWTGRDARRVFAFTSRMNGQNFESDMIINVLQDFGAGLTAQFVHHETLRSYSSEVECRVDGDRGTVVFDFWADRIRLESRVLGERRYEFDLSDCAYGSSFAGSIADFLLAVETGREPAVSARRNLPTMRTSFAELKSTHAGGAWISV